MYTKCPMALSSSFRKLWGAEPLELTAIKRHCPYLAGNLHSICPTQTAGRGEGSMMGLMAWGKVTGLVLWSCGNGQSIDQRNDITTGNLILFYLSNREENTSEEWKMGAVQ